MRPAPRSAAPAPRSRLPRRWWAALALFALLLLVTGSVVAWAASLDLPSVRVVIDGSEVVSIDLAAMPTADRLALAGALFLALVAVLIVVPLALLVVLAVVAIGVGVLLLIALLVAALALSPLLLVLALGRWLWRRSQKASASRASIAA